MNVKKIIQNSETFDIRFIRFKALCALTTISHLQKNSKESQILESINEVSELCSDILSLTNYVKTVQKLADEMYSETSHT